MSQVSDFLTEFNKMHRSMKEISGREASFGSLLGYLKNRNPVVERYYDRLNVFRELRNLIVHEDYDVEKDLTIPTQATIDEFSDIRRKMEQPGQIGEYFQGPVVTLKMGDELSKALDCLREEDYSKFPVFHQKRLVGVLADKGLLFWLSNHAHDSALDLSSIHISDIVENYVKEDIFIYYKLAHPQTSIYEVDEWFTQNLKNGRHHSIILMSKKDQVEEPEDILGIITPFDLPKISENL